MPSWVLGVDPGTHRLGVTLLEGGAGELLYCGPLIVPAAVRLTLARLAWVDQELRALVTRWELPDGPAVTLAVEQLRGAGVHPAVALDMEIEVLRQWAAARGWRFLAATPAEWRTVACWMGRSARTKADVVRWALAVAPCLRAVADLAGGTDALESFGIATWAHDRRRIFERAAPAAAAGCWLT